MYYIILYYIFLLYCMYHILWASSFHLVMLQGTPVAVKVFTKDSTTHPFKWAVVVSETDCGKYETGSHIFSVMFSRHQRKSGSVVGGVTKSCVFSSPPHPCPRLCFVFARFCLLLPPDTIVKLCSVRSAQRKPPGTNPQCMSGGNCHRTNRMPSPLMSINCCIYCLQPPLTQSDRNHEYDVEEGIGLEHVSTDKCTRKRNICWWTKELPPDFFLSYNPGKSSINWDDYYVVLYLMCDLLHWRMQIWCRFTHHSADYRTSDPHSQSATRPRLQPQSKTAMWAPIPFPA